MFALKPPSAGTALHHQVYLILRDLVLAGTYQPGDRLPIEPELAQQFGVSRITLRRAVEDLQRDGYLERVQGRGTFVCVPDTKAAQAKAAGNYVFDLRHLADADVAVLEYGHLPAPDEVAQRLRIQKGDAAIRSVRLRTRQGVPLMLLTVWVPLEFGKGITRKALERHTMLDLLAKNGIRFGRVLQEFRAILADPLHAERLQVPIGSALLQLDRVLHDRGGVPVQFMRLVVCSSNTLMVLDTPAEMVDQVSTGHFVQNWDHSEAKGASAKRRRRATST